MLVTVAVIGYFGYHYGSILLAGFKSAKASISSQTPVQDPGYPIDVDGQAPTNQVQADTEVVTEEVFKPTSAKLVAVGDNLMHRSCTLMLMEHMILLSILKIWLISLRQPILL